MVLCFVFSAVLFSALGWSWMGLGGYFVCDTTVTLAGWMGIKIGVVTGELVMLFRSVSPGWRTGWVGRAAHNRHKNGVHARIFHA